MIDILILLFTYIPAIFVHIFVLAGFVIFGIAYFLPAIIPQKYFAKYVGIILIVIGFYLEGGLAVTKEYLDRQGKWEQKVKVAEEKAQTANGKIEYVFKDKVVKVKETQVVIQERIRDVALNIDKQCKITKESIDILNDAAKNVKGK